MKVLLTCTSIEENSRVPQSNGHYPMGLAYIHSYIKDEHEVRTYYLNNVPEVECLETLYKAMEEFKPDVVGISMITHSRVSSYRLIEYLKDKPIKVVLGGIHATLMYEQLLIKYPYVIVVRGEGEITFKELLKNLDNYKDIKGIAYYDNGVKVTEKRELIDDLDILPFPEHELFMKEQGRILANILTARGCPFKCNFCVLDAFSRRKVRFRSVQSVVEEIQYLNDNFPNITDIWIHDDAFTLNNKRVIEICKEIIKRDIKKSFICSCRFKPISYEMLDYMQRAGFTKVMFGLESAAKPIIKQMHKGVTKEDAIKAIKLISKFDMQTIVFLMVGLPGETDETIEETGMFIQKLQRIKYFHYNDMNITMVSPGIEIYDMMKGKVVIEGYGIFDDNYWLTDNFVPYFVLENNYEKLYEMKDKLMNIVSYTRFNTPEGYYYQHGMQLYIENHLNKYFR